MNQASKKTILLLESIEDKLDKLLNTALSSPKGLDGRILKRFGMPIQRDTRDINPVNDIENRTNAKNITSLGTSPVAVIVPPAVVPPAERSEKIVNKKRKLSREKAPQSRTDRNINKDKLLGASPGANASMSLGLVPNLVPGTNNQRQNDGNAPTVSNGKNTLKSSPHNKKPVASAKAAKIKKEKSFIDSLQPRSNPVPKKESTELERKINPVVIVNDHKKQADQNTGITPEKNKTVKDKDTSRKETSRGKRKVSVSGTRPAKSSKPSKSNQSTKNSKGVNAERRKEDQERVRNKGFLKTVSASFFSIGGKIVDQVKDISGADSGEGKDVAGLAVGGPLWGAIQDVTEFASKIKGNDTLTGRITTNLFKKLVTKKAQGDEDKISEPKKDKNGRLRDAKGHFIKSSEKQAHSSKPVESFHDKKNQPESDFLQSKKDRSTIAKYPVTNTTGMLKETKAIKAGNKEDGRRHVTANVINNKSNKSVQKGSSKTYSRTGRRNKKTGSKTKDINRTIKTPGDKQTNSIKQHTELFEKEIEGTEEITKAIKAGNKEDGRRHGQLLKAIAKFSVNSDDEDGSPLDKIKDFFGDSNKKKKGSEGRRKRKGSEGSEGSEGRRKRKGSEGSEGSEGRRKRKGGKSRRKKKGGKSRRKKKGGKSRRKKKGGKVFSLLAGMLPLVLDGDNGLLGPIKGLLPGGGDGDGDGDGDDNGLLELIKDALPDGGDLIEGTLSKSGKVFDSLKSALPFGGKASGVATGAVAGSGGFLKKTLGGIGKLGEKGLAKIGGKGLGKTLGGIGKLGGKGLAKIGGKGLGKILGGIGKLGGKGLAKIGGKGLGKSILKKIPGIGLLMGGGFAIERLMSGDMLGALGELGSGVAGMIPGLGTAASVAIDGALMAHDIKNMKPSEGNDTPNDVINPIKTSVLDKPAGPLSQVEAMGGIEPNQTRIKDGRGNIKSIEPPQKSGKKIIQSTGSASREGLVPVGRINKPLMPKAKPILPQKTAPVSKNSSNGQRNMVMEQRPVITVKNQEKGDRRSKSKLPSNIQTEFDDTVLILMAHDKL